MTIKDYQYLNKLDTGSTTYEYDICKYFNIDTTKSLEEVKLIINKINNIEEYKLEDYITFNNRRWYIEKDILDSTFEQWIRLETIISVGDNLKNLHKLLAIYLRPTKRNWYGKLIIEPFNMDTQDDLANELLDLDISKAQSIILFFYQLVPQFFNHMKIVFLNRLNKMSQEMVE